MSRYVPWYKPDKLFKDIIWGDLQEASKYAKGILLDIGCGNKPYYSLFIGKVNRYIGLDDKNKNADIKDDFLKAKIKEKTFDTILCTQVLEHTPEPSLFLQKINVILKAEGILILTVPLTGSLHEQPRDFFRYSKYAIEYLLQKNSFKVLYIKNEGNWISSLAFNICFYLEGTFNKYYLRYPKLILISLIQFALYFLSKMPDRFTKPELFPINYIVVAKKK